LIHYTKTLKGAGQIQGGAGQTQGGANAPPRPPLKETLIKVQIHQDRRSAQKGQASTIRLNLLKEP